jgi:protein-S-isoprenylcysteine O-methyltransferase Ste14
MSNQRRVVISWGLVALQGLLFVCVLVGALATGVGPRLPASLWGGIGVVAVGVIVLLWAARNLGSGLTPLPLPNGAGLTAHGAYRWARHPIYTGVILACLGVAIGAGTVLAYAATLAVAVFFEAKTRLEERWLVGAYDGYAAYAARTGKFVPGIGRRRA